MFRLLALIGFLISTANATDIPVGAKVKLVRWIKITNVRDSLAIQDGILTLEPNPDRDFCRVELDPNFPHSTLGRRLDVPYVIQSIQSVDQGENHISLKRTFYDPVLSAFIHVKMILQCKTYGDFDKNSLTQILSPILLPLWQSQVRN